MLSRCFPADVGVYQPFLKEPCAHEIRVLLVLGPSLSFLKRVRTMIRPGKRRIEAISVYLSFTNHRCTPFSVTIHDVYVYQLI